VLETYEKAYNPKQPVLCMDEQPVQLLKETRVPIAATKQHGKRVDYEYERNGTASIFMFAEPLSGFQQATARERRTKVDWAVEVAQLLAGSGALVTAYEPNRIDAQLHGIDTTPSLESALANAEIIVLLVGHAELKNLNPGEISKITPARVLVDCVNGWNRPAWEQAGFRLYRLGDGSWRDSGIHGS